CRGTGPGDVLAVALGDAGDGQRVATAAATSDRDGRRSTTVVGHVGALERDFRDARGRSRVARQIHGARTLRTLTAHQPGDERRPAVHGHDVDDVDIAAAARRPVGFAGLTPVDAADAGEVPIPAA